MIDLDTGENIKTLYRFVEIRGGKRTEKFKTPDIKRALKLPFSARADAAVRRRGRYDDRLDRARLVHRPADLRRGRTGLPRRARGAGAHRAEQRLHPQRAGRADDRG